MITQINVIVHSSMPFDQYLNIQLGKANICMRDKNKVHQGLNITVVESIKSTILHKIIDEYNDYNDIIEDTAIQESDLDWT